jgi:hypothetical protein
MLSENCCPVRMINLFVQGSRCFAIDKNDGRHYVGCVPHNSIILRALPLQVSYSARSERLLVEQIDYNPLFRWFVGLSMDDAVWNHAVFSKNRDRYPNSRVL